MTTQIIHASDARDADAARAVFAHHAELSDRLTALVGAARTAALPGRADEHEDARDRLAEFCRTELLPHAIAEEKALYPIARADPRATLLVDSMLAEHRTLTGLVHSLGSTETPLETACLATTLAVLFAQHLSTENDQIVPLLAAEPTVSLAAALEGMHDLLGDAGSAAPAGQAAGGCGGCGCGHGASGRPKEASLDVRELPPARRHETVLQALETLPEGGALVLVAPHDPVSLLGQLTERAPGAFGVEYLLTGPEEWRLRLSRTA